MCDPSRLRAFKPFWEPIKLQLQGLAQLDRATTAVVQHAYRAVPHVDWKQVVVRIRIAPLGNASCVQFTLQLADGRTDKGIEPVRDEERQFYGAALAHWRLTQDLGQPRWYMMAVKLDRSGKYSVDFEYRDDYQVGDIMKALD